MLRGEAIVLNIPYLYLKKKKKEWKECMCRGSEGEEDREGNTKWLVVFLTSFPVIKNIYVFMCSFTFHCLLLVDNMVDLGRTEVNYLCHSM